VLLTVQGEEHACCHLWARDYQQDIQRLDSLCLYLKQLYKTLAANLRLSKGSHALLLCWRASRHGKHADALAIEKIRSSSVFEFPAVAGVVAVLQLAAASENV
jgi:hypothetical protein